MIERYFTEKEGNEAPDYGLEWTTKTSEIKDYKTGEIIFKQDGIRCPTTWDQLALDIAASKYFLGVVGQPDREDDVHKLFHRVSSQLSQWAAKQGTVPDAKTLYDELMYIQLNQIATFNSPLLFNGGTCDKPLVSACFILSIEDTLESILNLYRSEALIYKNGAGTGVSLSPLRSSREGIGAGDSTSSGPISFMSVSDELSSVVKSGQRKRRAAQMNILDVSHPDIIDFIECKTAEEKKARVLSDAGYEGSVEKSHVKFQNCNLSVRVTDDFMQAVVDDTEWSTKYVKTGEPCETFKARDIFHKIAEGSWQCGDPAIQFHDTTNLWHTCKNSGKIVSANPCGEYVFIPDSSCNLACINLLRFLRSDKTFDIEAFRHTIRVLLTAQEAIVDNANYIVDKIAENSKRFRPLGLSYTNLGALLMAMGLPYDSDRGRAFAGAITALLTGEAYHTSAKMAALLGPFEEYAKNRKCMLEVIERHMHHVGMISPKLVPIEILDAVKESWESALTLGKKSGFRNAQTTLAIPAGTTGFVLGSDTTGIEPAFALVAYKKLVGGSSMTLVNGAAARALETLDYTPEARERIKSYIIEHGTVEGSPDIHAADVPIFDCAAKSTGGTRVISPDGHILMMAALQPFFSGAQSKTINTSADITVEEIEQIYIRAWQLGLKSVTVYRDGSKGAQPLSTSKEDTKKVTAARSYCRKLPSTHPSITHKVDIGGTKCYITVGMYEDGTPGEIFITVDKSGGARRGLLDVLGVVISKALQYGVPLKAIIRKFKYTRFDPSGYTSNPDIKFTSSIADYIARFLENVFLPPEDRTNEPTQKISQDDLGDAIGEYCSECGGQMYKAGTCSVCASCGSSSGCS